MNIKSFGGFFIHVPLLRCVSTTTKTMEKNVRIHWFYGDDDEVLRSYFTETDCVHKQIHTTKRSIARSIASDYAEIFQIEY